MITQNIHIPIEDDQIKSTVFSPKDSTVLVLVTHEPGSGRFNHRNKQFVNQLYSAGLATLLLDWDKIKQLEEQSGGFNPLKMAKKIALITSWLKKQPFFQYLSTVLYGSSIGAASALIAASELEDSVQAVISRNGRLELAEQYLEKVKTPTLVAVGKKDHSLLESNKKAFDKLSCPKKLVILSGICPFFEEPNKVEQLGKMVIDWINEHSLRPTDSSQELNHQYS